MRKIIDFLIKNQRQTVDTKNRQTKRTRQKDENEKETEKKV
jgi:hypothetical protein